MTFSEKADLVLNTKKNFLCVGIDPDPLKIPNHFQKESDPLWSFCKYVVDQTADVAAAFKPNFGFFAAYGNQGWMTLKKVVEYIPDSCLTIGDGKTGDIGNTSDQYASAYFDYYDFDSITINPYMGIDSVKPFLTRPEKGIFLLVRTSNPGAEDFQTKTLTSGISLWEEVLNRALEWDENKRQIGFVVGATSTETIKKIRRKSPNHFLLIPGIGAQGGSLQETLENGNRESMFINVGRTLLYAHPQTGETSTDMRNIAKEFAEKMKK